MLSIKEMNAAAKMIEVDGADAYRTVTSLYGEEIAKLLLIAHLRRGYGSMKTYPPDPAIDSIVLENLKKITR